MLLSEIAREQNVLDLPLGWFPSKQGMVSICRMVYIDIFLVRRCGYASNENQKENPTKQQEWLESHKVPFE